ncbi:DEAD/DEAH box helicase [Devosia rhizoryzae]|uniref:DEAD/DEAH box helicase n=1 Tax=Devosia rhizoryzae TaxID=2774137 RepID=A0ABX7C493_9HYPH|nr:DEAD/DEAH box helicase [Devosia rhizoryzae]QQR39052.1 DEAD/DEAH box helicase [Devosia rhizoryzae]
MSDEGRLALARQIRAIFGEDQVLTPIQARSFVRSIQKTWDVDQLQWAEGESSETLSQAIRLVHAAGILATVGDDGASEAILAYRRAGELFEWLVRAEDELRTTVPLALFAAGAYQLGGLPAMSSGLLRQITHRDAGLQLFATFLAADFDAVLEKCAAFWSAHPDLTTRDAGAKFFADAEAEDLTWLATVELVRCLGLATYSLRRGDDSRFASALDHLKRVERFLVRAAPDDVALLAFFLRAACERYGTSSAYSSMRALGALRPASSGYLERFARKQYDRGRGLLWSSQQQGMDRLLNESSFALCTPTGSGKTLIANLAIVKELLLMAPADGLLSPLALYLVPSRALASEVEAKLTGELGREFVVTGLYGGSDWGITDAWLTTDTPTVLIATVEKADALLRYLGPLLLARLRLLIVDEAHQVVVEGNERDRESLAGHSSRALRLETLVSRILARKPDVVRIALTAVAGGAAGPVSQWIQSDEEAEPVGSYYRSTRQAVGAFEIRPTGSPRITLDMLNDRLLAVRGRDESLFINLRIPRMPDAPARIRNSLNHHTQNAILWNALHLVDHDRRILVSLQQKPEETIRWFAEALTLKGWQDAPGFVAPQNEQDAALFAEARLVCVDYCGSESHEVRLLDRGIATNHGQMPQRLRRMMVALIERSICRITVATATLTEGVNLPFDIIFLPLLKRTRLIKRPRPRQEEIPLPASEFRNLSGRAGRPGAAKAMEGMTLVALPLGISSTAAGSRRLQTQQMTARRAEYDDLIQRLVADAASGGGHNSPLSLLLQTIYEAASRLDGLNGEEEFLDWLEKTAPTTVSVDVGTSQDNERARLADTLDELDGVVLAAVEEVRAVAGATITPAQVETLLGGIWQRTFALVASGYQDWMERAFIRRGVGVVENIYPDAPERQRLYSYGFTPQIGRRFEGVANTLLELLEDADAYGDLPSAQRLAIFRGLGREVADDPGFGYLVRDTVTSRNLFDNWTGVLSWWMAVPGAPRPEPNDLRDWQIFVADNLEFRLGVAIGAVVARRWTEKSEDPFQAPTLATWKDVAALPWFAFWAKELLRWGTLEPLVAFALSTGMARSRDEAETLRPVFIEWLHQQPGLEAATGEELIDPNNYLAWANSRRPPAEGERAPRHVSADLTGTAGAAGRYAVLPIIRAGGQVVWLDAAGYELAVTTDPQDFVEPRPYRHDYDLTTHDGARVRRIF